MRNYAFDELVQALKHLPGSHNQRDHDPTKSVGHRYYVKVYPSVEGKLVGVEGNAAVLEFDDGLRDTYDLADLERTRKQPVEKPTKSKKTTEEPMDKIIARRKRIGTDVELDEVSRKYYEEALDDLHPVEVLDSYSKVEASEFGKGYIITGSEELIGISNEFGGGTNDHPGFIAASSSPEKFGLSEKDANNLLAGYIAGETDPILEGWDKMFSSDMIRVREFGRSSTIETRRLDNATLRRLQRLYDEGKLGLDPTKEHLWGSEVMGEEPLTFTASDFLSAKRVNDLRPRFKHATLKSLLLMLERMRRGS